MTDTELFTLWQEEGVNSAYVLMAGKLSTEKAPESSWIEDGVKYIASEAYGIAEGEEFLLYAPGMPADELPVECCDWWPDAFRWRNGELDYPEGWALYNVNTGQGFFTRWSYESTEA